MGNVSADLQILNPADLLMLSDANTNDILDCILENV